ncbi:AAA family ATPase, partial [Candidatus Dojkabacteria bacterium]|nr:AAA family ATPase [Candidatus Dojkabacteria bacterium]
TAYNKLHPDKQLDPWEFKDLFDAVANSLGLSGEFSERNLNEGFSGGEKKKSEVLQMLLLEPKLAILDEIDSGLDIDSLKLIFNEINIFMNETDAALLIISHNPSILEYIKPTQVHLLENGKLTKSGSIELAQSIIESGYE